MIVKEMPKKKHFEPENKENALSCTSFSNQSKVSHTSYSSLFLMPSFCVWALHYPIDSSIEDCAYENVEILQGLWNKGSVNILLLRYSDNFDRKCIDSHIESPQNWVKK